MANSANKVGRPSVMTDEVIKKMETVFSLDGSDDDACFEAGVSTTAYYAWLEKHPEFKERKANLKRRLVLKAKSVVADALNNKDKQMATWLLERREKATYSLRQEITGANGGKIEIDKDMSAEEAALAYQAMVKGE
jgi:hypothetical protein